MLTFLKPYVDKGVVRVWADEYIKIGDVWRREIDEELARAVVGLFLVGPYFLASDFIMKVEVPSLVTKAENGLVTICAVPISSGAFEMAPFYDRQWARSPAAPLDLLNKPHRHRALKQLAKQVVNLVAAHTNGEPVQLPDSIPSPELSGS